MVTWIEFASDVSEKPLSLTNPSPSKIWGEGGFANCVGKPLSLTNPSLSRVGIGVYLFGREHLRN